MAIYFNNDLFYNKSLNNISVNIVPWRDIIYFTSDLFLGLWRSIFSLALYFPGAKSLIKDKSPRGRPASNIFDHSMSRPTGSGRSHVTLVEAIRMYMYRLVVCFNEICSAFSLE